MEAMNDVSDGGRGPMGWRMALRGGLLLLSLLALTRVAAAQGTLIMYCGVDENWCRAMTTEYQKQTGVNIQMTRMSAGEIYARLRAEKENPQADIWWGGTGDPHPRRPERCLQIRQAPEIARMGPEAGGTIQVQNGRNLSWGTRLRL